MNEERFPLQTVFRNTGPVSVQGRLLLPILLLAALAFVPAASASVTLSRSGTALTITGDETDNVLFETGFDTSTPWFTTPAPGTLTAGAGCTQLSANNVECPGAAAPATASVSLGGGDDLFLWAGTTAALTIDGGDGDDELSGGVSNDTITGGRGSDILVGNSGDDRLSGNDGTDVIDGSGGSDRIDGGEGIDKLNGDGEGDATPKQFGNDTILSRDSVADEVECEEGADTVRADTLDNVAASCEDVSRSPATDGSSGPSLSPVPRGTVNPPSVTVTTKELTLKVRRGKLPKLGAFANSAAIRVVINADQACVATASMVVNAGEAKRLRFRSGRTLSKVTEEVSAAKPAVVTLRGSSRFRKAVRGRRAASVTLQVTCTPPAGKPVTAKLAVRLKR